MDVNLKWSAHVDVLCGKLAQRIHFLRRLRLFGLGTESMLIFSLAVLESIVRHSMAACYGTLTVQLKNKIANLVRMAMKVMGQKD